MAILRRRARRAGSAAPSVAISDLTAPVICAHRNAGLLAPENTLEGMRYAASLPGVDVVDMGDYRLSLDGALVAVHDTTMTSRTNLVGNVIDWPTTAFRSRRIVDASSWFGGGWEDTFVPLGDQVLLEFGGKKVIALEAKTTAAAERLALLIDTLNIGPSVLFVGGGVATAAYGVAVGAIGCIYQTSAQIAAATMSTLAASMVAANIQHIQVQHGSDLAKVQQLIDAGLKVWVYDVFRHHEIATYAAMNIFGYVLDDPLYTPNAATPVYRKPAVLYPYGGTWGPGHLNAGNNVDVAARGSFVGTTGAWRWQPGSDNYNLMGEISPVPSPAGSYTITVTITIDALGSDLTKWAGFYFGQPTDKYYNNGIADNDRDGYNLILRANGDAQLYRVVNGATTQIGSTSAMPDFVAGAVVTLTIAVTPTTINVTRSDGGAAIAATDSTVRGGYIFAGMSGYAQGMRVSFGAIVIS